MAKIPIKDFVFPDHPRKRNAHRKIKHIKHFHNGEIITISENENMQAKSRKNGYRSKAEWRNYRSTQNQINNR